MSNLHPIETWKPIAGWPDYEVSDHGRVRSRLGKNGRKMPNSSWRIINCLVNQFGYRVVRLGRQEGGRGRRWRVTVHRLALEAFVGPRPDGLECCHADDNKDNNRLSNLRWDTPKANAGDRARNGKHLCGEKHGKAKLAEKDVKAIRRLVAAGEAHRSLATKFRVSRTTIQDVTHRRSWAHV